MEDDLITLETAKLASKKGFNIRTPKVWLDTGADSRCREINMGLSLRSNEYNAPTQSLLHKWVRKNLKIFVEIQTYDGGYCYVLERLGLVNEALYIDGRDVAGALGKPYEVALEEGLKVALKIKKLSNGEYEIE